MFSFPTFLKFRVYFCPITVLAEFAEEVVLHPHQWNKTSSFWGECTTPNAIYLQHVVNGATRWRSVRLQDEFPKNPANGKALLFNIKHHKSYYDLFSLKLYWPCDSIKFIYFFVYVAATNCEILFLFLFLFCLVKVYCHADAAMKTVWKAWNGLLLTVNLPDFLQAVFGNFLLYSCLHTYKSII